tara:strand:- start:33 stop:401 length:369 start_codon:yes stop_codon:yes gene_type:complete
MAYQNKKIRSKISLDYNTGLHTQASSIITGRIINVSYSNAFRTISVSFAYMDSNDIVIEQSAWSIEGAENIDALFDRISGDLPPDAGECQNTLNKFYQGMLAIAADSWATPTTDWEIVDDIV